MGLTDDAGLLEVIAAAPQLQTPDETEAFLDPMPLGELASMWCALQRVSRRDQVGSIWALKLYFDRLPHRRPQQALDLVLEVLKSEADKPTVMQLNDKFLLSLLYAHGEEVIARIEHEAGHNDRLRWLLGGVHVDPDDPLMSRIAGLADSKAWQADHLAQRTPREPLDFPTCRPPGSRAPGSSNIPDPSATGTTICSRSWISSETCARMIPTG